MRIGHGYDVHRLVSGRKLILGGVEIPWEKGLQGHSDADVLTHAIMDAMLGAAALGDIGQHFPDNDERYLNIDSQKLLKTVCTLIRDAGYTRAIWMPHHCPEAQAGAPSSRHAADPGRDHGG